MKLIMRYGVRKNGHGKTGALLVIMTGLLLTGIHEKVSAQFKKAKMLKTTVSFISQKTPAQSFIDTTGEYGDDQVSFEFKTPLVSKLLKGKKAGSFGFWAILFKAGGSCTWPDFTYLEARKQLFRASAGISGTYYGGGKTAYLLNFSTFIAEDNYSITNPHLMFNGTGLIVHQVSKVFSYTVGAAYSFVFGSGLPLPVLGCGFNFAKRHRISMILPFRIDYRLRLGKDGQINVFIKPDGGLSYMSNNGLLPGRSEIIQLKQRVVQLGISCSVNVLPSVRIIPEAGLISKRKLSLTESGFDSDDVFFKAQAKAGYYAKLILQVRFGRKPSYGTNDAVNYLLDNGFNNLPDGFE